jgi:hypothetical protein
MTKPSERSPQLRRHHVVISIIAIVVALALALNYYLW